MSYANGPRIVTNGLILLLDAGNTKSYISGSTAWNNLSANVNNSTLVNGPVFSESNRGSIDFDGTNDHATLTLPNSIVTSGSISICLWAKWVTSGTTVSTIQTLIDNNHTNNPIRGFYIQDRPDLSKTLTFSVRPLAAGASSSFQVGDGNWHHIVGTNDLSVSKLYIDGVLNGSLAESGGVATVQPTVTIGRWQGTSPNSRYLNGNIANVCIYNRALTDSEVFRNYTATKGRFVL